jgi:hypothetical protein
MSIKQVTKTTIILSLISLSGFGQRVVTVPEAFEALNTEPEVILLTNNIVVPTESGHFQGVQVIGNEKLFISGSSRNEAYILQADLPSRKTEKLISLMQDPFRHAGGIQVSDPYLIVGIEDNIKKTVSKIQVYNYQNNNLDIANPKPTIDREGKVKRYTAGATGLLKMDQHYLAVVANWDSRHWDFYSVEPEKGKHKLFSSFEAPDDWAGYQAINLVSDKDAIYAIGFYAECSADLILVSKLEAFEPIMEKVGSKTFNCKNGVDFSGAAGLQVDIGGNLHIWGTQKVTQKQISINRFSKL